jgi:hypothetical protein
MKTTTKLMGLATIALGLAASQSQAAYVTIYDSLLTTPTASIGIYDTGGDPTPRWLANSFNMGAGGTVSEVTISMHGVSSISGTLAFSIYDTVLGKPGSMVASGLLLGSPTPNPASGTSVDYLYTSDPVNTPITLGSGYYWVVATPTGVNAGSETQYFWDQRGTAPRVGNGIGWASYSGAWSISGTDPMEMKVEGFLEVPEPGVMLTNGVILSAIGLGGFYYRRRATAKA